MKRKSVFRILSGLILCILLSNGINAESRSIFNSQRAWETIKKFIPKHIDNPQERLSEVRSQEAFVRKIFGQNHTLIRIDLIGFVHSAPGVESEELIRETEASDRKVLKLLNSIDHDSVGVEASSCEHLTMDCFVASIVREVQISYRYTPDRAMIMQKIESSKTGQPWVTYLQKHPRVLMAGLNDPIGLDQLHAYLIELDLGGQHEMAALDVRTDIGIARMLAFMKKRKLRHGVVLFGKRHIKRAEELLTYLHVPSTTY